MTLPLGQSIWEHIWKCTAEENHTNATNVTTPLLNQAIWRYILKHAVEKIQLQSYYSLPRQATWGHTWKSTMDKSIKIAISDGCSTLVLKVDWKEWTVLDGSLDGWGIEVLINWAKLTKKSSWAFFGFWRPEKRSWDIEKSSWDNIRFQIYSCESLLIICTARSKVPHIYVILDMPWRQTFTFYNWVAKFRNVVSKCPQFGEQMSQIMVSKCPDSGEQMSQYWWADVTKSWWADVRWAKVLEPIFYEYCIGTGTWIGNCSFFWWYRKKVSEPVSKKLVPELLSEKI